MKNDVGDENGAKYLQYVHTEFDGLIARVRRRLDCVFTLVF
jgi:hypothetical protein